MEKKADKIWERLTNRRPFNEREYEVIDEAITNLRSGISTLGQSYEEMSVAKGTEVIYTEGSTTLKPSSEAPVVIPNFPVPPPPKVEPRICQQWVDPWVIGNFDIQKGEVTEIRLLADLEAIWNCQYTRINLSGLRALKKKVEIIVSTSPQWEDLRSQGKSCSGLAFADLWTSACASCDFEMYLALHDTIICSCLEQVEIVKLNETSVKLKVLDALNPDGTKEPPFELSVLHPLSAEGLTVAELDAAKSFRKGTKHNPYLLNGPISTVIKFISVKETAALQAVMGYQRMVKTFGSKKRGIGKIVAAWNYAPRMSRVWREINMICALLQKVNGSADIRVSSGAFQLMVSHLKTLPDTRHRILLSFEQVSLATSIPVCDQHLLISDPRAKSVMVYVERKPTIPNFDVKKPEAAEALLKSSTATWIKSLPSQKYIVATTVYHLDAFAKRHVYTAGSNFDLSAVVSSYAFPVSDEDCFRVALPETFFQQAIKDMRPMLMWWHAPQRIFNWLGSVFSPPRGTLIYSKEEGFRMAPEFDYGAAEDLEEHDVPVGYEFMEDGTDAAGSEEQEDTVQEDEAPVAEVDDVPAPVPDRNSSRDVTKDPPRQPEREEVARVPQTKQPERQAAKPPPAKRVEKTPAVAKGGKQPPPPKKVEEGQDLISNDDFM